MKQFLGNEGQIKMFGRMRSVTVHQVPRQVTARIERIFLRDLQSDAETERPRIVLDCSGVQQMDNAIIHLLLSCLEEGMKRNGDVKLASLRPGTEAMLRQAGVNLLFEMYPTTKEAVHSFQQRSASGAPPAVLGDDFPQESGNAA